MQSNFALTKAVASLIDRNACGFFSNYPAFYAIVESIYNELHFIHIRQIMSKSHFFCSSYVGICWLPFYFMLIKEYVASLGEACLNSCIFVFSVFDIVSSIKLL